MAAAWRQPPVPLPPSVGGSPRGSGPALPLTRPLGRCRHRCAPAACSGDAGQQLRHRVPRLPRGVLPDQGGRQHHRRLVLRQPPRGGPAPGVGGGASCAMLQQHLSRRAGAGGHHLHPAPCAAPCCSLPQLYDQQQLAGATCGTVSPDAHRECCEGKVEQGLYDEWCAQQYPEVRLNKGGSAQSSPTPPALAASLGGGGGRKEKPSQTCTCITTSCAPLHPSPRLRSCTSRSRSRSRSPSWAAPAGPWPPTTPPAWRAARMRWRQPRTTPTAARPSLSSTMLAAAASATRRVRACCGGGCRGATGGAAGGQWAGMWPPAAASAAPATPLPVFWPVHAEFPALAFIKTPLGDCAGSLVDSRYVLTAAQARPAPPSLLVLPAAPASAAPCTPLRLAPRADAGAGCPLPSPVPQCVFGNGKAVKAGDVSLWVGGKWHGVSAVLVDSGAF